MAYGFKSGGRKKGTPNKRTQDVAEKLSALGVDPIESMARLAVQAEEKGDTVLAAKMYAELAPYFAPKRKATEITVNDNWRDFDYKAAIAKSEALLKQAVRDYEKLPAAEKSQYLENTSRDN